MKVILLQDVKGTGYKDQVIDVSDGFAHNFLLPKKMARVASSVNVKELSMQKQAKQHSKDIEKDKAQALAEKLSQRVVKFEMKAGKDGKLFGSVTSQEIAGALMEQHKIEVDKKKIILNEHIRHTGEYDVEIKLYSGVMAQIKLVIKTEA